MSAYRVSPVFEGPRNRLGHSECREILPGDDTPPSFWTVYETRLGYPHAVSDHGTESEALAAMAKLKQEETP